MKNKKRIIITLFLFIAFLLSMYLLNRKYRLSEHIGLQRNTLQIYATGDTSVMKDIVVKLVYEQDNIVPRSRRHPKNDIHDTLILFRQGQLVSPKPERYHGIHNIWQKWMRRPQQIRDIYNNSNIQIEYKDKVYDKIYLLKTTYWHKHDYRINLDIGKDSVLIDWTIKNRFEEYKGKGCLERKGV